MKVSRALAGLIAAAMLVAGCIGSDEESEPETSSTSSLAPTTTSLAPTTTVVRLFPEISWSMPARFGLDANSDGRIDVPNTAEYALNLPAGSCAGGCPVTTPTFTVLLSGADSQSDLGAIDDFTWEVRQGSEVVAGASSSIPEAEVQLAEGSYLVSLTVSAGGQLATATEEIIVADHLIVAIGDSYASGEGNPEANTIDSSGAIDRVVGIWADDGVGGPVAVTHRRAHRSTLAATPQAALVLEGRDDQSSVTLLFTARTGAEIDEGLLGPHPGSESEDPPEVPQIEAVAAMLGCEETSSGPRCNRTIDALTISIGGNDVGFNVVLGGLVLADPDLAFRVAYNFALNEVFRVAETGIEELPAKYAALDRAIRSRLEVDRIYLVAYPPAVGSGPSLCEIAAEDLVPGLEVDQEEILETVDRVIEPLAAAMAAAAAEHDWVLVDDHVDDFATHGYCGTDPYPATAYPGNPFPEPLVVPADESVRWFRRADESALVQGAAAGTFRPADLATSGTLHPNEYGHQSIRNELLAVLDFS
ncbi:MAG: hypothetical protein HKO82_11310 [Acidimicrobiia bacterium]|nr:hypothetical protein [Acidimicrobiia bacterium]